jgi:hypothetical protein
LSASPMASRRLPRSSSPRVKPAYLMLR